MIDVQFTDAQENLIAAEHWHDLTRVVAMPTVPGAVRTWWSDGETFVLQGDGETMEYQYAGATKAGKPQLPSADVILKLRAEKRTWKEITTMYDCSRSGLENKIARARQADGIGAQISGRALGQALAAVRGEL